MNFRKQMMLSFLILVLPTNCELEQEITPSAQEIQTEFDTTELITPVITPTTVIEESAPDTEGTSEAETENSIEDDSETTGEASLSDENVIADLEVVSASALHMEVTSASALSEESSKEVNITFTDNQINIVNNTEQTVTANINFFPKNDWEVVPVEYNFKSCAVNRRLLKVKIDTAQVVINSGDSINVNYSVEASYSTLGIDEDVGVITVEYKSDTENISLE